MLRVVLPDAGVAGEARGGLASGRLMEQLRGDWAEMRVLQWFRGVRPHQVRADVVNAKGYFGNLPCNQASQPPPTSGGNFGIISVLSPKRMSV